MCDQSATSSPNYAIAYNVKARWESHLFVTSFERVSYECQGRSKTRSLRRSKSRPVGGSWVVVRLTGEKGRWSVAEAALLPRGAFGGIEFSVRRMVSVCGGSV
jgi:hypothetical protein